MLNFILGPFRLCRKNLFLLYYTTLTELRFMYAGSVLGLFWLFLGPMIFLAVYSTVYTVIFKVHPVGLSRGDYIFYVFCGLLPFLSFSQSLTTGASAISRHKHVLLNTLFPVALLPIRTIVIAHIPLLTGFSLLYLVGLFFGKASLYWLLIPFVALLQILALSGVAFIFSLLTLVLKDIEQVLPYISMLLMVITPIAYTPDMIPSSLKFLSYINPLFYFTQTFQYLFVFHSFPPTFILIGLTVISLSLFCTGFWIFEKAKAAFFDMA